MDNIIGDFCHALETRFMDNGHSFDLENGSYTTLGMWSAQ